MQGVHPQHFPAEDLYIKVPLFTTLCLPLISRTREKGIQVHGEQMGGWVDGCMHACMDGCMHVWRLDD